MLKEKIQETKGQLKIRIQDTKNEYTNRKRERLLEKEREHRRKGMRKFGQAKLKHSTMGVRSCEYAFLASFMLVVCILISYFCGGKAGGFIGGIGIIAFVIAAYGIHFSLKGRRERDKNYITCKIGMVCNAILVLGMGSIFVGGFF